MNLRDDAQSGRFPPGGGGPGRSVGKPVRKDPGIVAAAPEAGGAYGAAWQQPWGWVSGSVPERNRR